QKEINTICRRSYRNFGITFLEFFCIDRISDTGMRELVKFHPPDLLVNEMSQNKGVIAVTGHFCSFELLGVSIARTGMPIDVVVKAMKNPRVEGLMDVSRERTNLGVVKVKDGFGKVTESIKKKRMIALVSDQDGGLKGIKVNFFGRESSTPAGPAVLALRTDAPMVVGFIVREKVGRYRADVFKISYEDLPESNEEKAKEITQRYTAKLEEYIRKYPEQYFWMHKRWKSSGLYN
ncbi:lysophospholipid acyltransferase family protein, partial [candidate division KSB1 bacterium]